MGRCQNIRFKGKTTRGVLSAGCRPQTHPPRWWLANQTPTRVESSLLRQYQGAGTMDFVNEQIDAVKALWGNKRQVRLRDGDVMHVTWLATEPVPV